VLTADHCADGSDHRVWVDGREYPATVHVRSGDRAVDLAVLTVRDLPQVPALQCARVDRAVAARVTGCRALGHPLWKGRPARPLLAQADGFVPTAEGADPRAGPGDVRRDVQDHDSADSRRPGAARCVGPAG
jgi:hypothetical protein